MTNFSKQNVYAESLFRLLFLFLDLNWICFKIKICFVDVDLFMLRLLDFYLDYFAFFIVMLAIYSIYPFCYLLLFLFILNFLDHCDIFVQYSNEMQSYILGYYLWQNIVLHF